MVDFFIITGSVWVVICILLWERLGEPKETESPIEEKLYRALLSRGHKVKPQVKCGPYRVDLTLSKYRIAIECDGKAYHSSPIQRAYDKRRSSYLYRNGYNFVLRFPGSEIHRNPYACVKKIEQVIKSKERIV